ncbi:hypothetical protein IQ265_05380 [Nodosilinea sp. LEGE 06152]|uniref:hypothetical protein n=1 Tax=Nodosilinea sp. LEGE 06152 TaxID=2777966 RepID=UPI001880B2A5|nr:hypothetical protein [Nodosilinea sp. LEGE 06152]MBE9156263.1 hypothetical protein [Nodosilinea sp. LEGE 06152]
MKLQSPGAAIALHRLELLATVAAVFAAAIFVGAATTLVAIGQAETSSQGTVMPSEAVLWQSLGHKE